MSPRRWAVPGATCLLVAAFSHTALGLKDQRCQTDCEGSAPHRQLLAATEVDAEGASPLRWVAFGVCVLAVLLFSVAMCLLPEPAESLGQRTIGLWGGAMLLANNVAGPSVSLMPSLTQQAGWFMTVAVLVSLASLSAACGFLLLAAMHAAPQDEHASRRYEFVDLLHLYLPRPAFLVTMLCYLAYLVLTLMTYIIQTAQVLDYICLDALGCAYSLELWPRFGPRCGTVRHSSTPFGGATVLSLSFLLVALICAPLARRNLDGSIAMQLVACVGLAVLAVIWIALLAGQPGFPRALPVATGSVRELIGVMLFNFAFMCSLPSWANEKSPGVSLGRCFLLSLGFVVVVYSAVGVVGGSALPPYYHTDENLFSKLNASDSLVAKLSVAVYPILQNLTSIPVFSIILRYNFTQLGWFGHRAATAVAFGVPWALSVFFYTGRNFENISEIGGLVFSSVVNFVLPVALFALAWRRTHSPYKAVDGKPSLPESRPLHHEGAADGRP